MAIVPRLEEQEMLERFQPIQDMVVIRKYKAPEVLASGLVVVNDGKDLQSKRGTIIKIGDCKNLKAKNIPIPKVQIGDEVLYSAFAGSEVPMPDGYLIMRITELMGVLEP